MGIEKRINTFLQDYPKVKIVLKRCYQVCMYAVSHKVKYEGEITCVSPKDEYEYFFGYYDKSPWDFSDRYMIALRVKQAYKSVAPDEAGELVLIDTLNQNETITIAKTHSWNVQQGCMAQWLGPDFSSRIIYNDFRDGKHCSVVYNVVTRTEERIYSVPVYDVAKDGSFALSLDFSRLHRLRPGYGYSNIPDQSDKVLCPDKCAIWKLDLRTGAVTELFKYTELASFSPRPEMENAEHKVNHLMISPNGERFMMLHRWFVGTKKYTRLVTASCNGGDLYNLSDDNFASHCYWKNDGEILSYLSKKESGKHYYLMKDKTQDYRLVWPELENDGHPSYSPDGTLVVTDTYPDRARMASVYICKGDEVNRIARVFAPFRYDNDVRCDLHPRWRRDSKQICFDAVYQGKRSLNVVNIKSMWVSRDDRITLMYLFTNIKRKGPSKQTSYIVKALDKQKFRVVLVTMFKEREGDSLLNRYLPIVDKHICLNINKRGIFKGELKKVRDVIKQCNPDIVQSMGVLPSYLADKYARSIHFMTVRNYAYEDLPAKHGKLLGSAIAVLQMWIIRNCKHKVACSKSLADIYAERNHLHFGAIRNSVELGQYYVPTQDQRVKMREKLNLPTDKKIFVYAAQINSRKNQMFAAEVISAANREDYCLVLLGDGPMLEEVKTKFTGNPQIILPGEVTNVTDYLYSADVYFSSSKSEGMPNGVMEAMACGLPVVLSDIPQHREILDLDSRIGTTYVSNSLTDAINAICKIADSDYRKMGQLARVLVEKEFDAASMGKKYEQMYEEIAHQNK